MPFDVVCTVHRCMERRVRQMASRTPSNGETEQASSKSSAYQETRSNIDQQRIGRSPKIKRGGKDTEKIFTQQ